MAERKAALFLLARRLLTLMEAVVRVPGNSLVIFLFLVSIFINC